jgi:S-sulfo-L-cysteine synthase (O-acetyl-L-serine-dependent)
LARHGRGQANGIEGLKPLGHPGDIVPRILDESLIDERISVTLEDAAATCRRLAAQGLFVGPSSGAFVWGALKLATTGRFRTLVTVLSDTGARALRVDRDVEAVMACNPKHGS